MKFLLIMFILIATFCFAVGFLRVSQKLGWTNSSWVR